MNSSSKNKTPDLIGKRKDLKTFFDSFVDFVVIADQYQNIIYANPTTKDRLGYTNNELYKMKVVELYPSLLRSEAITVHDNISIRKKGILGVPFVAKSGKLFPVETKLTQEYWDEEAVCICISRDISVRVSVERALIESERMRSTLMSNLPGIAYRCKNDRNWTMEFVSEGCLELTGYQPDDMVDNSVVAYNDLVHPEDREKLWVDVQECLTNKKPFRLAFRIISKSGEEKWVWEQGVGVYSSESKLLAIEGFISDITEQKRLEHQCRVENKLLKQNITQSYKFCDIIGKSEVMQEIFDFILQASGTHSNVVIFGESGTGKELVANAIHKMSERRNKLFMPVNCGAIPENLVESEFFGHKKGAFSGANSDQPGFLDLADGGTLFLDEVGELNLNIQVKLLRAIEGSGYTPVGGNVVKKPNLRIIAATNKNLKEYVAKGLIREDFFYRIHVLPVTLPSLRERREDIPLLVDHFAKIFGGPKKDISISPDFLTAIKDYPWPGNIRELQNVIQRYLTLNKIEFSELKQDPNEEPQPKITTNDNKREERPLQGVINQTEKQVILSMLEKYQWRRSEVAKLLDINYRTLLRKIKKYDLKLNKGK
ncbi:MAG: sigma 54-interacting transcriptional regulator [Deltaproteobacteria bacterium]|jgi:PAS domain S-box-containing protein|nr:sigma 54-interacting transcriptional regulator [Deltaproteobacteria bacterium]MBT4526881.1 sigma 54-interacting transcriptional regulator [Deltaproteobacteria bacterium]